MSNNTKKNTSAASAVSNLVDDAHVPNMQEKEPLSASEKMDAFFASMSAERVSTPVFALPANGVHEVVIYSYEYKNGYGDNGDYFSIALRDVEKNTTWNMTLPADPEKILGFLGEVNMFNNGIVFRLNALQAFGKLEKVNFKVWTQQFKNDKNELRVKTYANSKSYEKFARFIASQSAK